MTFCRTSMFDPGEPHRMPVMLCGKQFCLLDKAESSMLKIFTVLTVLCTPCVNLLEFHSLQHPHLLVKLHFIVSPADYSQWAGWNNPPLPLQMSHVKQRRAPDAISYRCGAVCRAQTIHTLAHTVNHMADSMTTTGKKHNTIMCQQGVFLLHLPRQQKAELLVKQTAIDKMSVEDQKDSNLKLISILEVPSGIGCQIGCHRSLPPEIFVQQ